MSVTTGYPNQTGDAGRSLDVNRALDAGAPDDPGRSGGAGLADPARPAVAPDPRPLVAAGLALGVGLGGFVDGIVFHQILQLHNMLSACRPPTSVANLEINMTWDGLFHAFTWLTTVAGVALLFRAGRRADVPWSGRLLVGATLAGWGLFNGVEGLIDHHLLGVHHVVERLGPSVWDWAFLASGPALVGAGWLLGRGATR